MTQIPLCFYHMYFGTRKALRYQPYVTLFQHLKLTLIPAEGNCAPGCIFDPASGTEIELTDLTPGQDYRVFLSTESYGKSSDVISFTEILLPGHISNFLHVVTSHEVSALHSKTLMFSDCATLPLPAVNFAPPVRYVARIYSVPPPVFFVSPLPVLRPPPPSYKLCVVI